MGRQATPLHTESFQAEGRNNPIVRAVLGRLLKPYEEAEKRQLSVWALPTACAELRADGLTEDLLLWLLEQDLIDQHLDALVLTERGAAAARGRDDTEEGLPAPHFAGGRILPCFDPEFRTLRYEGRLVKRFRQQADVQEIILRAFQKQGWPRSLKNPLPGTATIGAEERLHSAVRRLNGAQKEARLRFFRNGTRCTICWEAVMREEEERP